MVRIRRYTNCIERFLQGEKGQRFFNFAYSIGAAIVIWGALFKMLHLRGGNLLLCIGMGTEVLIFILSAFDRPPRDYAWEEVFPELDHKPGRAPKEEPDMARRFPKEPQTDMHSDSDPRPHPAEVHASPTVISSTAPSAHTSLPIPDNAAEISGFSENYARQLEELNVNIAGLNAIYGVQLKNMSGQIEAIDSVNRGLKDIRDMYEKASRESANYCEETEKMTRNLRQINAVYEKMVKALTVNMGVHTPGTSPSPFGASENPYSEKD